MLNLDEDMEGNITLEEYYNALEAYNCSGEKHFPTDGSDYYCSFEHKAMFKLLTILMDRKITYQELFRSCDVNNDQDVNKNGHAMIALIDSGNTSIQVPQSYYLSLMEQMRKQERSVYSDTLENNQVLIARKRCSDLYDVFSPIEFDLQGTKIVIKPRGYLYSMPGKSNDCYIGI